MCEKSPLRVVDRVGWSDLEILKTRIAVIASWRTAASIGVGKEVNKS